MKHNKMKLSTFINNPNVLSATFIIYPNKSVRATIFYVGKKRRTNKSYTSLELDDEGVYETSVSSVYHLGYSKYLAWKNESGKYFNIYYSPSGKNVNNIVSAINSDVFEGETINNYKINYFVNGYTASASPISNTSINVKIFLRSDNKWEVLK